MITIERKYLFSEKENLSKMGLALIIQGLTFNLVSILMGKILKNEGLALITTSLVSLTPVFMYIGREKLKENLSKVNKKFKIRDVVVFVSLIMFLNTVSSQLFGNIEKLLNTAGYTSIAVTNSSASPNSIIMLLYVILIAPLVEEIIYRGIVMRSLEKYSAVAAIIGSAVVFGTMHQNITQSPASIIGGLVLAYAAHKYSVKFSITVHIINNLIGQITRVVAGIGGGIFSLYTIGLYSLIILILLIALIAKRKSIVKLLKNSGKTKVTELNNIEKDRVEIESSERYCIEKEKIETGYIEKEKAERKSREEEYIEKANIESNSGLKTFFTRKTIILLILIDIAFTVYAIKPLK